MATVPTLAAAAALPADLRDIAHASAHVACEVAPTEQDDAYRAFEARAGRRVQAEPNDAGAKVWLVIILSIHAGERGGLAAPGMARRARTARELAQAVAPDALDGIDRNYFYADFPSRHGNRAGARAAVQMALAPPPRPDQPLADRTQACRLLQTLPSHT